MYDCFQHHRATERFPDWVVRDCRLSFKKFTDSVVTNNEIVYSNLKHFLDYKDKTVLIIGGGPSSNELDYNSIDRDFTWSCNHFYLNDKLNTMKIDLAMLMGEPDIASKQFIDYRNNYNPYLGFEVHDRWFNHDFDDYDKYFCMHTRFYSKLGIGARMIIFAAALGCKEIKFCGLDGYKPILKGDHAFQPGKTTLPSNFSIEKYHQQYDYFWSYIKKTYPQTTYKNLGYGKEFHRGCE